MNYFAITIEYDGTNYSGWQFQPNSITIQQRIEESLFEIFKTRIKIIGSGRTDAGVHSSGQVANFCFDSNIKLNLYQLQKAINHYLPNDIYVKNICYVDENFHSRFSALYRQYSYYLTTKQSVFQNRFVSYCKYPLNIDLLFESANIFKIKTDFTTFSKKNPDLINPVCNVIESNWSKYDNDVYKYTIKSNHFLYGMVRSVVGAMIDISRGKLTTEQVREYLLLRDRKHNSTLAEAKGLILEKIFYPEEYNFN